MALAALAACSAPDPLAGTQPGEHGRVVRVIDGDALVLDTGQSVRLVGIEAPAGP
jgi:endonuclease YncB( thermonuclease family)